MDEECQKRESLSYWSPVLSTMDNHQKAMVVMGQGQGAEMMPTKPEKNHQNVMKKCTRERWDEME